MRFPLGSRIPYGLIARIVRFRVKENRARATAKKRTFKTRIERAQPEHLKRGGIEAEAVIKKRERGRS